ncbi:gluconate 2-dehydrogenase subunit 3 family protein [Echinicola jeungdonensis]|uniref:Gluconate 2-dehydrogenase subunit 3 family protein n=1 Tax=Echinicola jeungdonensis TaxID=709343 RepID=A0ABV5J8I4_9BACT|nr:gluconate 2-dehydrogenase subunit 3 family protein [Echinicola jeungdonensis]MDN3669419.1 gluconate 2-dehydrogenase subunit 3 family protein [Echinicola jeungdonensis]
MNRRENLKLLFTGSLASGFLFAPGCGPEAPKEKIHTPKIDENTRWGRTPEELARNAALKSETFFTPEERKKLDYLVDVIIPKDEVSGSATEAGVTEFIEFMVKDISDYQTPMRGGLMWLDAESVDRFGKPFMEADEKEKLQIIDEIAFPDKAPSSMEGGVRFFNTLRNLTATGFFTSQMGFEDLGYQGNRPNVWNGVPNHILSKHGFQYEKKYLPIYLDPEKRGLIAQWDEDGNLIG